MSFADAIKSGFSNYANFHGRARRSEYWFFTLFAVLVMLVAEAVLSIVKATEVGQQSLATALISLVILLVILVVELGIILPLVAVAVRRLHDIDRSGWWYFLLLVPIVGTIVWLVWFCKPGTIGRNRFGDDPKSAAYAVA